jgi:UDP:flavonoid glycosyltransferase YjiC (YdhE family)
VRRLTGHPCPSVIKPHQSSIDPAPLPGAASQSDLRLFLGAFGDPGHAFPMLALGTALARRGHAVTMETWARWRPYVEAAGMTFVAAPEYPVFPTQARPLTLHEAAVRATGETRRHIAALRPHAVVADILTLAPALAGELEGVPVATLVPHVHPAPPPGAPPYSFGARWPRTEVGRRLWRRLDPLVERGLRYGQRELNATRAALGLPPVTRVHGGISDRLCLVATFPQLEYPRQWPATTHVVGPLLWEPPTEDVAPPPGEEPLVLVAPSTAQDRDHRLLRAALAGLGDLPIRVLATWNRRPLPGPAPVPANTRLVEWVSYARTMPRCAVVVCHVGHGTMVRALASGCAVVACPVAGDMGENAARLDWAGAGVRLPWRFTGPRAVRLAVQRALAEPALTRRATELATWAREHDAAARAAELVERLARGER